MCYPTFKRWLVFFSAIIVSSGSLTAAPKPLVNAELPIRIESDSVSFEQLSLLASHQGNVEMTQGGNSLHAETLSMQKDPHNQLSMMKATGAPAIFDGQTELSKEPIHASAKIIYYYPDQQLLVLEGQAVLIHGADRFTGPMLRYDITQQILSASKKNNQRPTIIIQPRVQQAKIAAKGVTKP